jgi:hypothetical protein
MTAGPGNATNPIGVEVLCPACGGLIEAPDIETLVALATEHCEVAHGYRIPREHVIGAVEGADP